MEFFTSRKSRARPPQPHEEGDSLSDVDLAVSEVTAKRLSFFLVFLDSHSGQRGFVPSVMFRWRWSNELLQDWQVYS